MLFDFVGISLNNAGEQQVIHIISSYLDILVCSIAVYFY